jgi:ABC-type polysaccharide/polyol phosphate transport system ATPase subunit
MPSDAVAVDVENLSKIYKVYQHSSDIFRELITRTPRHRDAWALKDVSFKIHRGEVVGLIGRNGAGKSTLLKIITGTLDATAGAVQVSGKVSALLELGTGFNPEYTGLENVYMGGVCLGMSRREIDRKLESIIEFSELAAVIDQPLKTYSTGMQARLAFATAISVDPEVFVIDEALSVGDVLFQEKCFKRIREIASSGATVLFVTHSYPLIYELCDRGLLLHKGELLVNDLPKRVGYEYERLIAEERGQRPVEMSIESAAHTDSQVEARVVDVAVVNEAGVEVGTLFHGQTYSITVTCVCHRDIRSMSIGFILQKPTGQVVYSLGSLYAGQLFSAAAGERLDVQFTLPCRLGSGQYLVSGAVTLVKGDMDYEVLHVLRESRVVTVVSNGLFGGDVDLQSTIQSVTRTAMPAPASR